MNEPDTLIPPPQLSIFIILVAVFSACLVAASVLSTKLITIFGFTTPSGVIAYSITFICTDISGELWGKKVSQQIVSSGFIASILILILFQASLSIPGASFWEQSKEFNTIIGSTPLAITGSLLAYLFSQWSDVTIFHAIRKKTGVKHLWLRNTLSTTISQFLDSAIFISVIFFTAPSFWSLIWGQWTVKILIAIFDTPIIYFLLWLIKTFYQSVPQATGHQILHKKTIS